MSPVENKQTTEFIFYSSAPFKAASALNCAKYGLAASNTNCNLPAVSLVNNNAAASGMPSCNSCVAAKEYISCLRNLPRRSLTSVYGSAWAFCGVAC